MAAPAPTAPVPPSFPPVATFPPAQPPVEAVRVRNRALFRNFFLREVNTRYLGSMTGLAWALLHPLALLGVYWFVFTMVFRAGGFGGSSFLTFVAVALWPWLAAQEALQRGTVSLASYAALIRKVAFPHELVVYASVAATFALHFAGYVAVLVVLALFGQPVHFEGLLVALPVWVLLAIAGTGLALFFAALQVFIRDVEHVLMPLLMILMYLTPIVYPLTAVPEAVRPYVAANPFGYLVGRLRAALLDGQLSLDAGDAVALVVAIALFVGGRWVFRRLSPTFEDFL
ncbi:MAG TPA: ABC transporter permease [Casimicrobiaceae bacterium]|nr:ABC transporter permease [Casimicrobiaceae bacterium]